MDIRFYYEWKLPYGCFSNFSLHPIVIEGTEWRTVEHYFQAMKFPHAEALQEQIRSAKTPAEAKSSTGATSVGVREDWDAVRDQIMLDGLRAKFEQNADARDVLLSTAGDRLVEHTKKDRYWGDGGDGTGENRLGVLLTRVREALLGPG